MIFTDHADLFTFSWYAFYIPHFCYWIREGDYKQTISCVMDKNHCILLTISRQIYKFC